MPELMGAGRRRSADGIPIFLTEERGVLWVAHRIRVGGCRFRACELLELLDATGELGERGIGGPGYELAPRLLSLARFYAIAE